MTRAQRNAAMDDLEAVRSEINAARNELWDAELNDDESDAEFWTDELIALEAREREILDRFPEIKYWPTTCAQTENL